jgi:murein DD-endopeptidase MepM/ murein hydrolase activator NlpD
MAKTKYKYDPVKLSYEAVSISVWKRIFKAILYLSPSILVGLMFSFLFTRQLDSPRTKRMKMEIANYERELERLNGNIELVDKVLDDLQKRDEDLYRVALYADEFPKELRMDVTGENSRYNYLAGFANSELLQNTSLKIDHIEKKLYAQVLSFRELIEIAKNKEKMLASIPSIQPVRNTDLKRMASGYGYRIDPHYKTRRMHTGMDFTAKTGTDVYATGDGYVESIESSGWGYGKCIVINHGFGFKTRYAHLSAFKVKKGQKISRGDLIGLVGSTGKSTGPHLHYEVEKSGKKVNPIHYYHSDLTPQQYEMLLEMSNNSFKSFD